MLAFEKQGDNCNLEHDHIPWQMKSGAGGIRTPYLLTASHAQVHMLPPLM